MLVLEEEEWTARAHSHAARVEPWTSRRIDRRARGQAHAIEDFLFDYYPHSPTKLATWHPGHGIGLRGRRAQAYLAHSGYRPHGDAVTADLAWLEPRLARLDLARRILARTQSRAASTACFGLHEWAMVYGLRQDEVRHETLPLRVSPAQVTSTVRDVGLRCTHIDAYRFFTDTATPLNEHRPTRASQPEWEQPGCLHAGMDLYKYAFWFSPLVASELVVDCFENAAIARTLDMRASPYDVTRFGLEPIPVETPEGRREYAAEQRRLMESTAPLRARLGEALDRLRAALETTDEARRPHRARR